MSASPTATADTTPELLTVATDVADDCHAACAVTTCTAAVDIVAFAANCEADPMTGVVPITVTRITVGVGVVTVGATVD
jgi:hypothetical protein